MTGDGITTGRPGELPLPDATKPTTARFWDFALGGKDNMTPDREIIAEAAAIMPDLQVLTREQRLFVDRAVEYLVGGAGIRQLLDIGAGIPAPMSDNVHEVAQRLAPRTRVVYVDKNPVAVSHMSALQADGERTLSVGGDLREPAAIVENAEVRGMIDFTQPVGVLLSGILHFISDEEDPAGIVARLRAATAPGSYLVVNHISSEVDPRVGQVVPLFERATDPMFDRGRAELEGFLDGFELVEPGLVPVSRWRPSSPEQETCDAYGAVARRR